MPGRGAWLLLSLAALGVGICAARAGTGGPAVPPVDASALLQLGAVAVEGQDAVVGEEGSPKVWRHEAEGGSSVFPLIIKGEYRFVAAAAFMLDWMEKRIHFYDVAAYLKESSPMWNDASRRSQKNVDLLLGEVLIFILPMHRLVSRKALAALVDALTLFAENRGIENYTSALGEYKRCYRSGPRIQHADAILLRPNRTGLLYSNGDHLCFVRSGFLGLLVLDHYLGRRSDFPELREAVAAQLSEGKPEKVTEPRVVGVKITTRWWVALLLVLLGLALCIGLLCVYHNFCRVAARTDAGTT